MATQEELRAQCAGRAHLNTLWQKLTTGASLSTGDEARLALIHGRLSLEHGDETAARAHLARAQALADASADPEVIAAVLIDRARLAWQQGRPTDGLSLCTQAEHISQSAHTAAGVANTRGLCEVQLGHTAAAEQLFNTAIHFSRITSSTHTRATALSNLANLIHAMRGDLVLVQQFSAEALSLYDALAVPAPHVLGIRCWLYATLEEPAGLEAALTRYLSVVKPGTHDDGMAATYAARLAAFNGDYPAAHGHADRALSLAYKTGSPYLATIARLTKATLHARCDEWALAHSWAEDLLRETERGHYPEGGYAARVMLARVALAWQDAIRAGELLAIARAGALAIANELLVSEVDLLQVACADIGDDAARAHVPALWAAAVQRVRVRGHEFLLAQVRQLSALSFLQRMARSDHPSARAAALWVATEHPPARWVTHHTGVTAQELELIGLGRDDARPLIDRLLGGDVLFTRAERAQLLLHESFAHEMAGRLADAARLAQSAYDAAERAGVPEVQAAALSELAYHANYQCAWPAAVALGQRSVAQDPASAYAHTAWRSMALGYYNMGDWELAERAWQSAEAAARNHGNARAMCMVFYGLAPFRWEQGRDAVALETARQCARFGAQSGFWEFAGLELQTSYLLQTGRTHEARAMLQQMARAMDQSRWVRTTHTALAAELALAEGDTQRALTEAEAFARITREQGRVALQPEACLLLARVSLACAKPAESLAWADEAHVDALRLGMQPLLPHIGLSRARAALALGDLPATRAALSTAYEQSIRLGALRLAAHVRLIQAVLEEGDQTTLLQDAAQRVRRGGYDYLLEQDRELLLPRLVVLGRSPDHVLQAAAAVVLEQLAAAPPRPLHIRGFGGFELRAGPFVVDQRELERRKAGELFRMLLLAPAHTLHKDEVMELLWPGAAPAAAGQSLNQATSALRRALEPELPAKFASRYLSTDGDRVRLHLPPGSVFDVFEFERLAGGALGTGSQASDAALALVRGDLFPDDRYAAWAAAPRERLRAQFVNLSVTRARAELTNGNTARALALARAAVAQDTWNEPAVQLAIQAALSLGDRAQAIQLYRALERALRDGLGIAPNGDLRKLVAP